MKTNRLYFLYLMSLFIFSCSTLPTNLKEPKLELKEVALADATLSDTMMLFRLEVTNPNSVPLKVDNIEYDIKLNGKPFGKGEIERSLKVRANSSAEVEIPIKVVFTDLFDSIMVALHNKTTDYEINAMLSSGRMRVPLKRKGKTPVLP